MMANDARARLDEHYREHLELVARSQRMLDRGAYEAAAAWAQIAGHHAWMNHTGVFASPELESILGQIGAGLPAPARRATAVGGREEVLQVVTQCYGTGGSTQALACWIQQDAARHHRLCITRQRGKPAPDKILAPLERPEDLIRLDTRPGGLVSRAARLRAIASDADIVLLHTHPYDVVPLIAFSGTDGLPPVVYVEHADHVFWLGLSVANVVMQMRDSGRRVGAERRNIKPDRVVMVPRPLRPPDRVTDRLDAKRQLGVAPEQVLLVTAADPYKYEPVSGPSFLDVITPFVESHPSVSLYAAGPTPDGAWLRAAECTGGRVRALGMLPDTRLLQEAADVYVDSYPFSSLTSLLEAGALGVPALTFRGHPDECAVFAADTPCINEHLQHGTDPHNFGELGERLVDDPAWRTTLGESMSQSIRSTHTGPGWLATAEALYEKAAVMPPPDPVTSVPRCANSLDLLVDRVMIQTGFADGRAGAVREHMALLPLRDRLTTWAKLTVSGGSPEPRKVLPEWMLARLTHSRQVLSDVRSRVTRSPTVS